MATTMTEDVAKTLSTFTSDGNFTLDDFIVFQDIDADHIAMIERYEVLRKKTSTTSAEKDEMTNLLTELQEYMPTSVTWNQLCACMLNLEVFVRDGLVIYIKEKENEFKEMLAQYKYAQEWNSTTTYYFGNLVSHNGYGFLNIYNNDDNNVINLNHEPNIGVGFDTYWARFTIKGDKGDVGISANYKGEYSSTTTYSLDDAVTYNGIMYYAKSTTVGNLPTNNAYWAYVDKLYVGTNSPVDTNLIWLDTSNNKLKRYIGSSWTVLSFTANEINTIDTGNYFSSNTVEGNLQEIGANMIYNCGTANGTNTYIANATGLNSYTQTPMLGICVMFANSSNSNATININSLGAKNLLDSFGNAFSSSNTLKANIPYTFRYNGTNFILQAKGGGGTAIDAHVLSGDTYTNNNGLSTGTMANQPAQVNASSVGSAGTNKYFRIPNGAYLTNMGSGYPEIVASATQIDSNINQNNIKSGVSICGVSGKSSIVDTGDATAGVWQILSGYSAYINGQKINGQATIQSLGGRRCKSDIINYTNSSPYVQSLQVDVGFQPSTILTFLSSSNSFLVNIKCPDIGVDRRILFGSNWDTSNGSTEPAQLSINSNGFTLQEVYVGTIKYFCIE
jgi:hypothetical protein